MSGTSGGLGALRRSCRPMESLRCNNLYTLGRHATPVYYTSGRRGWRWPAASQSIPLVSRHASLGSMGAAVTEAVACGSCADQQEDHHHHHQPDWKQQLPSEHPVLGAPQKLPQWNPPDGRPGLYDTSGRLVLKSLTLPELEAWCASEGEGAPANRALQLWRWMYADPPAGSWVRSLEETEGRQNGLSAKFIAKVGQRVSLDGGLRLNGVIRATDGTRKLVFTLTEGEAAGGSVETVLIPIVRRQGLRDRLTICVSSQVGCAMNCQFCYTGRMGLLGNLTTAQIVEQVVEARRFLAQEGDRTQLTNLVFMGMGEPLHNTEAVLAASDIVNHYMGLHISHNKITISTVGLVPEMRSVLARSRVQMALSLHATTDEVRDWIVPVNRRYDLATLTAALEELFPKPEEALRTRSQDPPPSPPPPQQQQEEEQRRQQSCCQQHAHQEHQQAEVPSGIQQPSLERHQGQQHRRLEPSPLQQAATEGSGAAAAVDSVPEVTQSIPFEQRQDTDEVVAERWRADSEPAPAVGRWLPSLGSTSQMMLGAAVAAPAPANVHSEQDDDDTRSFINSCSNTSYSNHDVMAVGSIGATAGTSSQNGAADGAPSTATTHGSTPAAAASHGSGSRVDSCSSGRSLLVEYTMLHGINDTLEDAQRLAAMLARITCKVNLIVFNPHAGTRFQPSTEEAVTAFRSTLVKAGLVCTIRDSRGNDEMAACGQLGSVGLAFRPSPILEAPERFRRFLLPPGPAAPPKASVPTTVAA